MAGEEAATIETQNFKNPPCIPLILFGVPGLAFGLFVFITDWIQQAGLENMIISTVAFITLLGVFLLLTGLELFFRPFAVEVGDTVTIRKRGRRPREKAIESVDRIKIGKADDAKWSFRYNSSAVWFVGDENVVLVNRAIATALYDAYRGKMGREPVLYSQSNGSN